MKRKDITGKKSCGGYGMLTGIEPTNEKRHNEIVWEVKCDCGKNKRQHVGEHNIEYQDKHGKTKLGKNLIY
jgi:hypothetical protein